VFGRVANARPDWNGGVAHAWRLKLPNTSERFSKSAIRRQAPIIAAVEGLSTYARGIVEEEEGLSRNVNRHRFGQP